jgi:hypothetical protein
MRGARSAAESFSILRILPQREGLGGWDARERTREKNRIEEQTNPWILQRILQQELNCTQIDTRLYIVDSFNTVKNISSFPIPNRDVTYQTLPVSARECLVSDIPAEDGKTANLFLQFTEPNLLLHNLVCVFFAGLSPCLLTCQVWNGSTI